MASTNSTNATVTMTISTSNTIGGGTEGTSGSGGTGVAGSGGPCGTGRSVGGGADGSSSEGAISNVAGRSGVNIGVVSSSVGGSGGASCSCCFGSVSDSAGSSGSSGGGGSTSISGGISVGGVISAVGSGPSGGSGSTAACNGISVGGGSSAVSSTISVGGGSTAVSSGISVGGGSTAVGSGISVGGGSTAVGSGISVGGGSTAVGSVISVGGGSTAVGSGISVGGGSTAVGSAISVGGGRTAVISGISVGGGSTTVSSGISVGGGSTAVSSGISVGGGSTAVSSGISVGGGSTAVGNAISVAGGSTAVSSDISVGGGSTTVSSGISVGGGSTAVSCGICVGGGSTAASSGSSGGKAGSAVSSSGGSVAGISGGPGASVSLTCMISQNEINWYRIGSLLYNGILPAMLSILHNDNSDPSYIGLPRDPTALYNELMKQKPVIDKLAGKPSGPKIINKDQLQVIYPKTKTTDSGEFDITLTVILIRNLLKLPKPQARWDRPIKPSDSSIIANCLRGQQLRNFFAHNQPGKIDTLTLDGQFVIGERILKDFKYTKCDTRALKADLIDRRTYSMIRSFTQKEKHRLDNVETRVDAVEVQMDAANRKAGEIEVQVDAANKKFEEVEIQVDATNNKIDEVEVQADITNKKVGEVEVQLDVANKKVNEVEGKMNATNQKVDEVEGQMNATNQKVDEVEGQMNATNQKVDEVEGQMNATNQKVDEVEGNMNATNQKVDEVEGQMNATNQKVDEVEGQMNATNQKVNEIEGQMNATNQRVDEVEGQMNATNQKIDEVEGQMNATNQKVDEVEGNMNATNQKVDEVEGQMNATNQKVDEVEGQMNATNQKVNEIEVQLDVTNKKVNEVEIRTNATNQKVDAVEYRVINTEQRLDADAQQIKAFKYRIEKLEDSSRESGIELAEQGETWKRADKTMRSQYISNDAIALKRVDGTSINVTLGDDGTSHFHFIQNTNWSIWTHHSKNSNPSEILHSFNRSKFIPNEINCQLYECGYTKHYKEHEMDEHHLRKFRCLFSEDMKNQPWLLTNLHVDCIKSLQFHEFLEKLKKWCTNREYSFMLLNYSCEEHLCMLNVNLDELRLSLQNPKLKTENEHVLVYVATDNVLMSIRFVTSSGPQTENNTIIDQAVLEGQNDLKLFTSLHMSMFKDFNITLVSVTVLDNMTRNDLPESVCTECFDTLIITQDEWLKENVLKRKLDTIVAQKQKISEQKETSIPNCSVGECFEKLSSRLWGWLSTKDVYLPNMSIHGPSCLARIYLNNEQLKFMHLTNRHLMLKGPYGSGKSIMGMTKFRDLAVKATSSSCLYFICCSSNTMYTALMKSRLREMLEGYLDEDQLIVLNLDEYAQQFGLPDPAMVSDILQDMAERHKEHTSAVGVIFDEYDASYLTFQEAHHLDSALLKLKDSYILILCQSLETTRTKVIKKKSGLMTKKNKTLYDAFRFDLTSMQIETFHLTMRNCTRVNELSCVATDIIQNAPNEYFEREMINYEVCEYTNDPVVRKKMVSNSPSKETNKGSIDEKLEPDTRETLVISDKESHSVSRSKDYPQSESGSKDYPQSESGSKDYPQSESGSKDYQLSESGSNEYQRPESRSKDDQQRRNEDETLIVSGLFDHLIKNLGNTSETYTGVCIKSMFRFPGKWLNGHSVEGDIPQLIYPFGNDDISYDNVNSCKNKKRIGFALQSLIGIPTRLGKIGVICFDPIDAQLFCNVLVAMDLPVKFYAPMLFPTQAAEVAPDLRECARSHIVITDHVGAQGLELNQLIVSIDPNEKYVHQYIVEAITRCIYSLFIFLIPKRAAAVKEKGGATKQIVNNWMKNNLVQVSTVTFCKVHQKDEIESPTCENENKKGNKTYHIHHWHEFFDSYTAINNCEVVPINTQRLVRMSKTIANTRHVQEMIKNRNKNSEFSQVEKAMKRMDLKSFSGKYNTKHLRKIRGISGETLLDAAEDKLLKDYVAWFKSIGIPGSVRFHDHRGATLTRTVTAPRGAVTTGAKVMYEVTFGHRGTKSRIGWATPDFQMEVIGSCWHSYSYRPYFGNKYHNNIRNGTPWGIEIGHTTDKVLGVAADLQSGRLLYAWDGNWEEENMGVAFESLPPNITLFPAISYYWDFATKVNFGDNAFKFKPPDSSYKSIIEAIQ